MILSDNTKPELKSFRDLMIRLDTALNSDAHKRQDYYSKQTGEKLQPVVYEALKDVSYGTQFQGTIFMTETNAFPDIKIGNRYGVQVKSTEKNKWKSTGSSILESTRIKNIERIFLTFGKLGKPVQFKTRPYEECLYGIAVTHMPRYMIDMNLNAGETIFDKMGISYDELRSMESPVAPVSEYYRKQLKPGETLWWASDPMQETVSAKIRLWKNVPIDEKANYVSYGCAMFPEIFAGDYERYSLWLASQGVVDSHIRDQFSAGGQVELYVPYRGMVKFPGVYKRVLKNKEKIMYHLAHASIPPVINRSINHLILNWIYRVSEYTAIDFQEQIRDALTYLFFCESYMEMYRKIKIREECNL